MRDEHQHLYVARSGHLAAMSEFLYRGLNVAMPEVDVGDDVFVVRDADETVTRVQVKSANATVQRQSYAAQFSVSLRQLQIPDTPALVYVLPVRRENRWSDFVVIRRSILHGLYVEHDIGSRDGQGNLILRLVFTEQNVENKGISLQRFRNAWEPWPPATA